jgi:hypothetical protein
VPEYTKNEIDELISCAKAIVNPPKKTMSSCHGSRRNDMTVQNGAGARFRVFMRQSEKFSDDFSIGLAYEPTVLTTDYTDGTDSIRAFDIRVDPCNPWFFTRRRSVSGRPDAIGSGHLRSRRCCLAAV